MFKDPETGEAGSRQVVDTIVGHGEKELVDVGVDAGSLVATAGHPFWVDDQGKWVDAEDLEPGDLLLLDDGSTIPVEQTSQRTAVQRVHNLTVDGLHTYYVAVDDSAVLVHNCTIDEIGGLAADFDRDELAQLAYQHAGEGDLARRPTIEQIYETLGTQGSYILDRNAVEFIHKGVKVIINEDVPWKSTAFFN